jgi:hypothetical protein
MSEVANVKTAVKTYTLPLGHTYIKGRITSYRRWNNSEWGNPYFTILRIPAPDEYSFPGTIEVMSSKVLGQLEQDWEGEVEVTGMRNNFYTKPDSKTGEVQEIKSARNWLRVIE